MLVDLIRAGLATAKTDRIVAGGWLFLFFQMLRSITMQPERWAKRLIARAIPFMTLGNPIDLVREIIANEIKDLWREKIYVIVSS
jgi:hypothetical protein